MKHITSTYAIVGVPDKVFQLIKKKLEEAGYQHALAEDRLVMDGLALEAEGGEEYCPNCDEELCDGVCEGCASARNADQD